VNVMSSKRFAFDWVDECSDLNLSFIFIYLFIP
jgi:hypothetical protein